MKNTKVTVIVPIYKVEKYLPACMDSIFAQTHTNLEIILVDDGSPDSCPALCDGYAAQDSRIVVIHQENGGLFAARNAGLDVATGEYIAFCDADDSVPPDAYAALLAAAQRKSAEITTGAIRWITEESITYFRVKYANRNRRQGLLFPYACVWDRLFRRDFLLRAHLRFRALLIGEDTVFMLEAYAAAVRTGYTNTVVYNYYVRVQERLENPSLMQRKEAKFLFSVCASAKIIVALAASHEDVYLSKYAQSQLRAIQDRYFAVPVSMRSAYFEVLQATLRDLAQYGVELEAPMSYYVPCNELILMTEDNYINARATRDCYREMQERCACGEVGLRYLLGCLRGWAEFKWHRLWKES